MWTWPESRIGTSRPALALPAELNTPTSSLESPSTPSAIWFWPVRVVRFKRMSPFGSTWTEACAAPLLRRRIGVLGSIGAGCDATAVFEEIATGLDADRKAPRTPPATPMATAEIVPDIEKFV